jgi:hypothetical protein
MTIERWLKEDPSERPCMREPRGPECFRRWSKYLCKKTVRPASTWLPGAHTVGKHWFVLPDERVPFFLPSNCVPREKRDRGGEVDLFTNGCINKARSTVQHRPIS